MKLAKQQLGVGTMVQDRDVARVYWTDAVGLSYTKFEKIADGVRQRGVRQRRIGSSVVRCVEEQELERPTIWIGPGLRYLSVQVQHVDPSWPRLVEMGFSGEMEPPSLGETARVRFIRDPDGGDLEVSERAEFTGRPIPCEASSA